jgi:hypothetical protein
MIIRADPDHRSSLIKLFFSTYLLLNFFLSSFHFSHSVSLGFSPSHQSASPNLIIDLPIPQPQHQSQYS